MMLSRNLAQISHPATIPFMIKAGGPHKVVGGGGGPQ